jgi:hypothetical protein
MIEHAPHRPAPRRHSGSALASGMAADPGNRLDLRVMIHQTNGLVEE